MVVLKEFFENVDFVKKTADDKKAWKIIRIRDMKRLLTDDSCEMSKKKVSIIRKYHNHTLQTNPRHRKEEPHNTECRKEDI